MDDLEFVQRCIKGGKLAWDEFLRQYSRLIYNYIHSILKIKGAHSFSQENINDLFQDIFLSLAKDNFKKLRSFQAKNECSLASWLRQVTVNCTIDYIRKIKPTVSIDEETKEGFNLKEVLADDALPVNDALSQKERITHLKDCIERLEINDQYFLELHIHQGLTLEELRGHFRISRAALYMRKSRIIDRLKECFKSKGYALDF